MKEEADVRKRNARNREQKKENKKTPLLFALCQILLSKTKNLCRSINNSPKTKRESQCIGKETRMTKKKKE